MKTLFIFADGLGLGDCGADNPLSTIDLPGFERLCSGSCADLKLGEARLGSESGLKALDACFGVPGLPQSATGQVSLFCGVKAPVIVGRHVNAYPNRRLCEIIEHGSILSRVKAAGGKATFLNGYRGLDTEGLPLSTRLSVTTLAVMGAGIKFRTRDMVCLGAALTHDITGEHLPALGQTAEVITPERAALNALAVACEHDLSLFEFFLTDLAGHQKRGVEPEPVLKTLDSFLWSVLANADPSQLSVALCSDHGNIEDLSVRTHTTNPVPFALWGGQKKQRDRLIDSLKDISDVSSALETWIRWCF